MFLRLCDTNGDGKIEVEEFGKLMEGINCMSVGKKLAGIVVSTGCSVKEFMEVHGFFNAKTDGFVDWS